MRGHFHVEPTEPAEKFRKSFTEDAGEQEDVEEEDGGQHVEENQNGLPGALGSVKADGGTEVF